MPRTAHNDIHDNQTEVVLPKNPDSAKEVAAALEEAMTMGIIAKKDPLAVRLDILACLFEKANEPAVSDSLRKQQQILLARFDSRGRSRVNKAS